MSETRDVIVVLGAPNSPEGDLSPIALGRAERALEEYRSRRGCKVLLTGGFGDHFNTSNHPHAHFVARHLVCGGVREEDILPFVHSANTVEDALLSRTLLAGMDIRRLRVVTSDFHQRRAEFVFRQVFPDLEVIMADAPAAIPDDERRRRRAHEATALRRLRRQGGIVFDRPRA